MTTRYYGVIQPILSPRFDNGELDLESLANLTRYVHDAGVNGIK